MPDASTDLDHIFKLRVVVARVGEMDLAQWWNTKGQLGSLGAAAVRRGMPRTHYFAQARSVFHVAAHRCEDVFNPPGSVTLWRLPREVEERIDARWENWLDAARDWDGFFEQIANVSSPDLAEALTSLGLVNGSGLATVSRLAPDSGDRSVQLPGQYGGSKADLDLLALAFSLRLDRGSCRATHEASGRMIVADRSQVVSSFTLIKGTMLEETYQVFTRWDVAVSKRENLDHLREENYIGAASGTWLRDVALVLNRRYDPAGRDAALVILAKGGCPFDEWRPIAALAHDARRVPSSRLSPELALPAVRGRCIPPTAGGAR